MLAGSHLHNMLELRMIIWKTYIAQSPMVISKHIYLLPLYKLGFGLRTQFERQEKKNAHTHTAINLSVSLLTWMSHKYTQ